MTVQNEVSPSNLVDRSQMGPQALKIETQRRLHLGLEVNIPPSLSRELHGWQYMPEDNPANQRVGDAETSKTSLSQEQWLAKLQVYATKKETELPYLSRNFISAIPALDKYGWKIGWSPPPVEITYLQALFGAAGHGYSDSYSDKLIPQAAGHVIEHLFPKGFQGDKLLDTKAVGKDVVSKIVESEKQNCHYAIDAAILTAVAYKDYGVIVDIVAEAVKRNVGTVDRYFNILEQTLDKLDREGLLQDSDKEKMTATFSCIGEGRFAEMANYGGVDSIKTQYDKKLAGIVRARRDRWIASQRISDTQSRKNELEDQALEQMVDNMVESRSLTRENVAESIDTRIGNVFQAEVANSIAGELTRRMYSEFSVGSYTSELKQKALGTYDFWKNQRHGDIAEWNEFENLGLATKGVDMSFDAKRAKIDNTQLFQMDRALTDDPNSFNFIHLVKIIENPQGGILGSMATAWASKFREPGQLTRHKSRLATKLLPAYYYIESLVSGDNKEGYTLTDKESYYKKVLSQEFGIKEEYLAEENMERVHKAIKAFFDEDPESFLEGNYELQRGEDLRVQGRIYEGVQEETRKLDGEKRNVVDAIITAQKESTDSTLSKQAEERSVKTEQQNNLSGQIAEQAAVLEQLKEQLKTVESAQVGRRFLGIQTGLSLEQKTRQI